MPSQAGNLPAKSKKNSSSQTGDLSYPDHTGEYWFQPLSRLTGREGLSGASWTPTAPRVYISSPCPGVHQINGVRSENWGPFLVLKPDTEFSFYLASLLGIVIKPWICCVT